MADPKMIRSKCINCHKQRKCIKIEARAPLREPVLVWDDRLGTHVRNDYEPAGPMVEICRECLKHDIGTLARFLLEALIVLLALLSGCAGTFGGPARERSGLEPALRTSAATVAIGLLTIDAGQTWWAAGQAPVVMQCPCVPGAVHGWSYGETNPILGARPSTAAIAIYFSTWIGGSIAVRAWGPRWASWALSGITIAAELVTVHQNRIAEEPYYR